MRRAIRVSMVQSVCVSGLFVLGGALPANADWVDDFNGGLQAAWQFGSVTVGGGASATFTSGSVSDQLELADSSSAAVGGAAAGFGVVLDLLGDQRMTGIVNPNGDAAISSTMALLARGDVLSSQFYAAEVNYDTAELIIFRNDGPATVSNLSSGPIAGLTTADRIYLEFDLLGNSLVARAYDAPNGNLLQSVSATDSAYTIGASGVLVSTSNFAAPILGAWDDVSATTIPEPSTATLIFVALGGAMAFRRRRVSR